MNDNKKPVSANLYTSDYFLNSCGGIEFFKLYGPQILKPPMAYAWRQAAVQSGMRILDVGCGRGELLYHIRKAQAEAVGTDFSENALHIARKVSGSPVVLCDAKTLPFVNNSFDIIFFLGVIDHLYDWELKLCFAEFRRVLRPGGKALVHTCTNHLYYKNWTYNFRRLLCRIGKTLGFNLREPSPPRSDEDFALHVNEHTYGNLRKFFFSSIGWKVKIDPRPNYKYVLEELYGNPLPPNFPLKQRTGWKRHLYMRIFFRPPFNRILAREFFCTAFPKIINKNTVHKKFIKTFKR